MDSKMKCRFARPVKAMRPPKCPKTPQLAAQDGLEVAQETPKTAQEPPKNCLNDLQEAAQRSSPVLFSTGDSDANHMKFRKFHFRSMTGQAFTAFA